MDQKGKAEAMSLATKEPGLLARAMRVEWLGQMVASLCWMSSVLVMGIKSSADWLQMAAAFAWFVANVAALVSSGPKQEQ